MSKLHVEKMKTIDGLKEEIVQNISATLLAQTEEDEKLDKIAKLKQEIKDLKKGIKEMKKQSQDRENALEQRIEEMEKRFKEFLNRQ
jgi:hypothetical protein